MLELNNHFFGVTATALSVIATVPYISSILRGETRPSGASWWTWTILGIITVTSSWFAGATWSVLLLPLWLCLLQLIIAILSIKYGDNTWDRLNKFCVISACIGIGLWLITGEPLIALGISVAADLFASIPNFRHSWKNPEQENRTGWTLGWISSVLEIFAISTWSLAESGWALYFVFNMTTTLLFVWRPAIKSLFRTNNAT